ncbi:MAG: DUF4340 domain-containing protein [Bryobacteraceae bacterium]
MKSERLKTLLIAGFAVALVAAAAWIEPEAYRPEIFSDQGQPFFEKFRDVMAVKAIEVVDYDETQAVARPLKVEFRKGRWVMTSHNDYPADARDRLAKTAAELVDLKKDIVVSERVDEHAKYGVIDPLDAKNASLTGRGKRLTLRDAQGAPLVQLVLGSPVKERAGYRYVRLPGEKRVYAVQTGADPSARFEDWVEGNLLRLSAASVRKLTLNSYSIDETAGRLMNMQRVVITRGEKDDWRVEPPGKPSAAEVRSMVAALASLRVSGARPKPDELARQLKTRQLQMTLETVMSLRQRGFFITPDGRLLAKEGEIQVETENGWIYSLRFGEVVSATGKEGEDRYLFVTVTSPDPAAQALDARFADWYYVVSGADFAKLRRK